MDFTATLITTALAWVVVICSAAIVPGRCPVVVVKDTFDPSQYAGRWYEIRSYFALYEQGLNCSSSFYSLANNNCYPQQTLVNNSGTVFDKSEKHRVMTNKTGIAYAPNFAQPAKLLVKFDVPPPTSPGDYWVIDTDYTGYSIVWSCHNIAGGFLHSVFSWILSRTPAGFSNDVEVIIDRALAKANVDSTLYQPMVQKNCVNY